MFAVHLFSCVILHSRQSTATHEMVNHIKVAGWRPKGVNVLVLFICDVMVSDMRQNCNRFCVLTLFLSPAAKARLDKLLTKRMRNDLLKAICNVMVFVYAPLYILRVYVVKKTAQIICSYSTSYDDHTLLNGSTKNMAFCYVLSTFTSKFYHNLHHMSFDILLHFSCLTLSSFC
jgi:hypothetical protein